MVKEALQNRQIEILCEFNNLAVIKIDPNEITLLEKNANFMDKKNFDLLVENIKKDDTLTSLPLCIYDGESDRIVVISGNHRVKACIKLGMEKIPALIFTKELSSDDALRLQLGHNAIHGKDDIEVLKDILKEFGDVDMIKLAGIDEEYFKTLPQVENIKLESLGMDLEEVTLMFGEDYVELIKKVTAEINEIEGVQILVNTTYPQFLKLKNEFLAHHNTDNIIEMAGSMLLMQKLLSSYAKDESKELGEGEVDGMVSARVGSKYFLLEEELYHQFKDVVKKLGGEVETIRAIVDYFNK